MQFLLIQIVRWNVSKIIIKDLGNISYLMVVILEHSCKVILHKRYEYGCGVALILFDNKTVAINCLNFFGNCNMAVVQYIKYDFLKNRF